MPIVLPVIQNRTQNFLGIIGFLLAHSRFKYSYQAPQLRFGHPYIQSNIEMGSKLAVDAVHAGQGRNGRDFPALEIQVVASENVPEQMIFIIIDSSLTTV